MRYLFGLITLTLLINACSDSWSEGQKEASAIINSLTPDSLIVAQLIQKSKESYKAQHNENQPFDNFLKEAEELASKGQMQHLLFDIYHMAGKRCRNKSFYAKSMSYQKKALLIAEELDEPELKADIYNQMGTTYRRIDENSKALDMHMKSLLLAESIKDSFHISSAINGMGNVSYNLNRNLAAIEYFQRSLHISRKKNNVLGMAINTNNIGDVYQKLNNLDSALYYHFESLDHNSQINSKVGQSICYNSIGSVYTSKKQYRLALDYLFKALEANLEAGDGMYISISYTNIGKVYLEDNHPDEAIPYLKKALDHSRSIGSKYTAEEASKYLSKAYELKGMYKTALGYNKLSKEYRDSTLNEKNIFHMAMAEDDYQNISSKLQMEALSQQTVLQKSLLSKQKDYFIVAIIIVVILILIATLIIYQNRLRHRNRTLKFQQRLLRSQMNPHFIFNALSAIQVFILENDMVKSNRFLSDFSKLMRQVLRSSNYEYISIKEEVEILQYYLNLQQLRFSPPFKYYLDVDEELKNMNVLVPPMLIQPFIENSIEHGIKPIGQGGEIYIRFKKKENGIIIEVDDNGIGIDYTNNINKHGRKHESMALKITKERLDIIEKDTRQKTILQVFDKRRKEINQQGTIVRLVLPLIQYNK